MSDTFCGQHGTKFVLMCPSCAAELKARAETAEAACAAAREILTDGFRWVSAEIDGVRASTDPVIRSLDNWSNRVSDYMNATESGSAILSERDSLRQQLSEALSDRDNLQVQVDDLRGSERALREALGLALKWVSPSGDEFRGGSTEDYHQKHREYSEDVGKARSALLSCQRQKALGGGEG